MLALAAISGSSAVSAACVLKKVAELPVTMSNLQPTISAKIDGKRVRMLADTGAFFSMISPAVAAEMKLPVRPTPYELYVSGVGGGMTASVTTVKEFDLDTIALRHVDFIVGGSESGPGIDGVVGRNMLVGFDGEYDLANGVVRLIKPDDCFGRPLAYWAGATPSSSVGIVVDSDVNDSHPAIVVLVTINGQTLKATLDTGSSNTVIWRSAALRAGIPLSGPTVSEPSYSSGVGKKQVREVFAPVRSFKIGNEEIKNTKIAVDDTALEGSDMLLGADFFLAHRIYIALGQHKIYFTYNGGPVFNLVPKPLDAPGASVAEVAKLEPVKAAPGEPTDAAGFSRRGSASAGRLDYAHALADLDRAVAMAPDEADYRIRRAEVRRAAGQSALAMSDLDRALALRPTDVDALLLRAEIRIEDHHSDDAIRDVETASSVAPNTADARFSMALLFDWAGSEAQSLAQYDLWIAAHPEDNRRSLALGGRCWARALLDRELDRALADCNGALRADPKNRTYLDSRGLVYLRKGDATKSIADYDAALALDPKKAWSLYGRGLAKLKIGDAGGGKADLDAAIAIDSSIADDAAKWGLKP